VYTDFIGVASHELFHVWNVKTIRPADLMPYHYGRENYSRLGFVYEGVTTYYGDLFLARCGVFDTAQYFRELNARVQKHMDHFGRLNMSVSDASFDTWLDGYVPGIPNRKTSIYDEGCLTALMTDLLIRKKTAGKASLDDVMRILFNDFGKQQLGYTEHDYLTIIENVAGESLADFFIDYVYGTEPYLPMLQSLLNEAGCELASRPGESWCEHHFGFRFTDSSPVRVKAIVPGSPAALGRLGVGDEVVAVNGIKAESHPDELCRNFPGENIVLSVMTPMHKLKDITLVPAQQSYYAQYFIRKMTDATLDQQEFFKAWIGQEF
jgi:predicted metalloprotease with PDZ domain